MMDDTTEGTSRRRWVLPAAMLGGLLILGLAIGSVLNAFEVNSVARAWLVARGLLGQPKIRVEFDADRFGEAALKSTRGAIPPANIFDGNLELLADFADDSRFRAMALGVGRIDLLVEYDDKDDESGALVRRTKVEACSAAVVSETLVLTAFHCTQGHDGKPYQIKAAQLRLGYRREGTHEGIGLDLVPDPITCNPDYDCVLFEIKPGEFPKAAATGVPVRAVGLDRTPLPNGRDLVVIHHPLGGTMHVTRRGCRVQSSAKASEKRVAKAFLHECGTLPGTSGAPIFDECRGTMVALHVRGDRSLVALAKNEGQGIAIGDIVDNDKSLRLRALLQPISANGCPQ